MNIADTAAKPSARQQPAGTLPAPSSSEFSGLKMAPSHCKSKE